MMEQYRKANDRIHVPEELMQRTKEAVRQEEKKQKIRTIQRYTALAACLCLICLGAWMVMRRDRIIVQDVQIARTDMETGMNFGIHGSDQKREDSTFHTEICESKEDVPEEMWQLRPSRISGQEVYIGRTDDGVWHAAFEKDGTYIYATEDHAEEKEFTEHLKEIL